MNLCLYLRMWIIQIKYLEKKYFIFFSWTALWENVKTTVHVQNNNLLAEFFCSQSIDFTCHKNITVEYKYLIICSEVSNVWINITIMYVIDPITNIWSTQNNVDKKPLTQYLMYVIWPKINHVIGLLMDYQGWASLLSIVICDPFSKNSNKLWLIRTNIKVWYAKYFCNWNPCASEFRYLGLNYQKCKNSYVKYMSNVLKFLELIYLHLVEYFYFCLLSSTLIKMEHLLILYFSWGWSFWSEESVYM